MKIKTLLVVVILSTVALTQAHGFGLGAQFNFSAGSIFAPGVSVVFSPSRSFHIAGNWYLGNAWNIVGLTLDVAPLNFKFLNFGVGSLAFTLGIGAYANIGFAKGLKDINVTGGVRLPVGLSLSLFKDFLEIYAHVAPSLGVRFSPSIAFDKPFFPIAVGARVWIFS